MDSWSIYKLCEVTVVLCPGQQEGNCSVAQEGTIRTSGGQLQRRESCAVQGDPLHQGFLNAGGLLREAKPVTGWCSDTEWGLPLGDLQGTKTMTGLIPLNGPVIWISLSTLANLQSFFCFSGKFINLFTFILSMAASDIRKLISYRANFHVKVKLQVSWYRTKLSFCPSSSSTPPIHCSFFFQHMYILPSSAWSQMSAERGGHSGVPFSSLSGIFAFANSFNWVEFSLLFFLLLFLNANVNVWLAWVQN